MLNAISEIGLLNSESFEKLVDGMVASFGCIVSADDALLCTHSVTIFVRFGEVLEIAAGDKFEIKGEIKSEEVSRETTYAAYLVFKLPQHHSNFEAPQQQRSDGWTEVLAWVFQTWTTTKMIYVHLELKHPGEKGS
ncbi:kinase-like domain, phloem protein 2-like protein [Tanacetum coccineum]